MSFVRILMFCGITALAACSSGGEHHLNGQAAQLQDSYDSVKLTINPQAKDSGEIVPDLRSSIMGQLMSSGHFRRVASASESADLVVNVDITGYERVSVGERIVAGIFAGRNRIITDVSAVDGKSGATVRSFQASGKSAAHPLSSEAGYSDALREVSKEIILGLTE